MLKLLKAAGIEMTHVPYKGGAGQMLPALITGEVQVAFINLVLDDRAHQGRAS